MRFYVVILISFILASCSSKTNTSQVSVSIPSLSDLKRSFQNKVSVASAGDISWDNACFMITVNGSDLSPRTSKSGELANAVFAGSVAPSTPGQSQTLTMDVPKGSNRRFDVFAFFRPTSTEQCKTQNNINVFDRTRIGRLGFKDGVSIQLDHEDVTIDIALPTSLLASANVGRTTASSVASRRTNVNNYLVSASAGFSEQRLEKTQTGYVFKRKRGLSQ